jgi:hypothetical protein
MRVSEYMSTKIRLHVCAQTYIYAYTKMRCAKNAYNRIREGK